MVPIAGMPARIFGSLKSKIEKDIIMKVLLVVILVLVGLVLVGVIGVIILTPWMDRWGATDNEVNAIYPGDELVPTPSSFVNRAITIHASAEKIYPWLVQIGAGKGGWYSYSGLERLMRCPIVNADRIHEEWQNLQVGDVVKLCPNGTMPPPYTVAQIHPNQAIVMGHKENDQWVDLWQFMLVPQVDGSTRLISRTRTMMTGGFWDIIHPGVFIMETGMLKGIKHRAEINQ
jgi:hypothetical protein